MRSSLTLGQRPDDRGFPSLDAHALPKEIRHGAILGALEALSEGRGLVLTAPHDPQRLLAEVNEKFAGAFEVEYVERETAWRLRFTRRAPA